MGAAGPAREPRDDADSHPLPGPRRRAGGELPLRGVRSARRLDRRGQSARGPAEPLHGRVSGGGPARLEVLLEWPDAAPLAFLRLGRRRLSDGRPPRDRRSPRLTLARAGEPPGEHDRVADNCRRVDLARDRDPARGVPRQQPGGRPRDHRADRLRGGHGGGARAARSASYGNPTALARASARRRLRRPHARRRRGGRLRGRRRGALVPRHLHATELRTDVPGHRDLVARAPAHHARERARPGAGSSPAAAARAPQGEAGDATRPAVSVGAAPPRRHPAQRNQPGLPWRHKGGAADPGAEATRGRRVGDSGVSSAA